MYQPKTGKACGCKRGVERDNCSTCEGTGMCIDFKAIRDRKPMIEIKVVDVRCITGDGKLAAFADVELGGVVLIKGFCVVKTRRPGKFEVLPPRKPSKDGAWFDICIFNPEFWDRLEPLILDAYAVEVKK